MKLRFLYLIVFSLMITASCRKIEEEPDSLAEVEVDDSTAIDIESNHDVPHKRLTYSIIGNSISTYSGYIPSGYRTYYPKSWFKDVNDTWWMRLSELLDMELLVNASWSGSTVSGSATSCFTSDDRISYLSSKGVPNYIFIAGGTNDYGQSKPLGVESDEENFNKSSFRGAYSLMLYKMKAMCPNAKVVCLGIFPRKGGYDRINSKGWTIREANRIIELLARKYDFVYIDMEDCGLGDNFDELTNDGLHPNAKGMELIAVHITKKIQNLIQFGK